MGLPKAGKTTLAAALKPLLRAVHFNADAVRENINKDLGFSVGDRIEQARRMGWMCDRAVEAGHYGMADFVCPTAETRTAFGDAFTIWVDTKQPTPFADTAKLFEPPGKVDYHVSTQDAEHHARLIAAQLFTGMGFDWQKPTALFVGRYQPFHDGHKALVLEGIARVGQACIAVRDTQGTDEKNPFGFAEVEKRIRDAMTEHEGKFAVIRLPNITNILYGRDVGYKIEKIELGAALEAISATKVRAAMQQGA
ncbi:MAG: adenylyl-sulfate kinase [Alphaproteobacteria bacterium]|nr:adenylyl-sulfate kinase [Alphaproteobacteria bacterium]